MTSFSMLCEAVYKSITKTHFLVLMYFLFTFKINKKKLREWECLDFPFVQNLPEGFSATFVQAYGKLCSFAISVRSTSHLP